MLGEGTLQVKAMEIQPFSREGPHLFQFFAFGVDSKHPTVWISWLLLGNHVGKISSELTVQNRSQLELTVLSNTVALHRG